MKTPDRIRLAGALAAVGLPALGALALPALGADVPLGWWMARAFGLLAYVALWLTTLFGVLVSARGAGGFLHTPTTADLHRAWSLVALAATAVHVLAVVADPVSPVPIAALAVPFVDTGAIALGTVAGWLLVGVAVTTAVRDRLPTWAWRAVHAGAFGLFVLALAHAVTAGADTGSDVVKAAYLSTAGVLLGALVQRIALQWDPQVAG